MSGPPFDDPNFDLYADQRGRIIGSLTAIFIITTVTVALRILSRHLARAGFWVRKAYNPRLLGTYLNAVTDGFLQHSGMTTSQSLHGHIYLYGAVEGAQNAREWLKILWTFELAFHTITTLAKYSILAFYYRIFPVPAFRRILIWVAIVCTLYMIAIDLAIIFQWYSYPTKLPPPTALIVHPSVNQSTTPGIKSLGRWTVIASMSTHSSSVADPATPPSIWLSSSWYTAILTPSTRATLTLTHFAAYPPPMAPPHNRKAANSTDYHLHNRRLVLSIIWIVVLARLEQADVTCTRPPSSPISQAATLNNPHTGNYINTVIWSVLEPSMAVVCACIPSLRPLYSVAVGGFQNMTSVSRSKIMSSGTNISGRGNNHASWRPQLSRSRTSDGLFSPLQEELAADDAKPLGHG
ncbi:MAG: hypothetical protein Q9197_006996, partial [Variospora fuerteventurae]